MADGERAFLCLKCKNFSYIEYSQTHVVVAMPTEARVVLKTARRAPAPQMPFVVARAASLADDEIRHII